MWGRLGPPAGLSVRGVHSPTAARLDLVSVLCICAKNYAVSVCRHPARPGEAESWHNNQQTRQPTLLLRPRHPEPQVRARARAHTHIEKGPETRRHRPYDRIGARAQLTQRTRCIIATREKQPTSDGPVTSGSRPRCPIGHQVTQTRITSGLYRQLPSICPESCPPQADAGL